MYRIVRNLILFLLIWILASCEGRDRTEITNHDTKQISWPVFRGSEQLDGYTDEAVTVTLELKWTYKTGYEIKSSPVIGNGRVYIGSNDGKLYCLDLHDGSLIWLFDAGDDLEAAPLLSDHMVLIGSLSGDFYALDRTNGTVIWQFRTEGEIYGSANILRFADPGRKQIIFGSYDNFLYCLNADSGSLVWNYETTNYINGTPATDGKWIVFGGCDENLHILSAQTGQIHGQVQTGSYIAGSPALYSGIAYLGHYGNKILAINLADRKIIWHYENPNKGGAFFSSPAVNDKYVIIGSRDNYLHCLNRTTGDPVWTFRSRDDIDCSPVISGDKVVAASDDGNLYILDVNDGRVIWTYEIGAAFSGSPAVAGGFICQGAEDGRLYLFGEK